MSVGARLAQARRAQNLTQEQLAEILGVTRQAVGKKVLLAFYEKDDYIFCDYARLLDFDGGWANIEFVREKKDKHETRLIPLSAIRTITILPEGGED